MSDGESSDNEEFLSNTVGSVPGGDVDLSEWFSRLPVDQRQIFYSALFQRWVSLHEEYEIARETHIETEIHDYEKDWRGMVNFRDAYHHTDRFAQAIDKGNPIEALEELNNIEDHLERAAYDGPKKQVETLIKELDEQRRRPIVYSVTLLSGETVSEREFKETMSEIKELYKAGRSSHSPMPFDEAVDLAEDLKKSLPSKSRILFRGLMVAAGFAALLGLALTAGVYFG